MKRISWIALQLGFGGLLAGLIAAGGCAGQPAATRPSQAIAPPATSQSAPQSVSYYRTGGIAGGGLGVAIDPKGHYQILGGPADLAEGQLTPRELAELASLFDGWDRLDDNYPAPEEVADVYRREIRYGPKTVTASDAAVNLPPRLHQISQWLDALIQRMPPNKKMSHG